MGKDNDVMLTTTDNPWNPFTDFEEWYKWDTLIAGYNTCGWLGNLSYTSPAFSDEMNDELIEMSMDDMVKNGPYPWKKVTRGAVAAS